MDFDKLCTEILKLNNKIRYAGVYATESGKVYEKLQEGIQRILTKEQTSSALVHAYTRWKTRQHLSSGLGQPIYATAKYSKINRMTLPCASNALLMINTESDLEPHKIVDDVLNLIGKYSDDPNHSPRQPFLG